MPRVTDISWDQGTIIREAYAKGATQASLRAQYRLSYERLLDILGDLWEKGARGGPYGRPRKGLAAVQEVAQAMQATVMHHRDIPQVYDLEPVPIEWQHKEVAPEPTVRPHSYLERVKELEKRGFTPSLEDITSEDEQPDTPQTYTPQEYFEAIADGLRQRDVEINTLRLERDRLRAENQRLLSDLSQCKLQMANWTGPSVLPNRSLGNGG